MTRSDVQSVHETPKGLRRRSLVSLFGFGRSNSNKYIHTDILDASPDDAAWIEDQVNENGGGLWKLTFFFSVAVPGLIAAVYYGFIASDQYLAETRLIVRTIGISEQFDQSEDREGRAIIGGDSLNQDAYIVASYLKSPQLVTLLDKRLDLRSLFSSSDIDFISRLNDKATSEELYKFWTKQTYIDVDGPSGIITFGLRAFTPEEPVMISSVALKAAGEMIDALSERAKNDIVKRAESEVVKNLAEYQKTLETLRNYQNEVGILDPLSRARTVSSVIVSLIERKLEAEAALSTRKQSGVGNSSVSNQLEKLIKALDDQISIQRAALTTTSDKNDQLSERLIEFSRLETQRLVAESIYEAAIRNLDTANSTALRRTTFLAVFSPAHVPQESQHPRRFSAWLVIFMGFLTLWVIVTLLLASVDDHRN